MEQKKGSGISTRMVFAFIGTFVFACLLDLGPLEGMTDEVYYGLIIASISLVAIAIFAGTGEGPDTEE